MQKQQLPGDLSPLIPIPAVENQIVESGAARGNASVQSRILAIALTNTVFCILTSLVVQWLLLGLDTALPRSLTIGIIATVTGVSVGISTYAFGRLTLEKINRNLEHLKSQFEEIEQGNVTKQSDLYSELMPLQSSFQQIIVAIKNKLNQAEQTATAQEKQNQYLEEKLLEIVRNLDLTDERKLWKEAALTSEDDATPTGSLLEFLDNFHKWSQLPTAPELLLGSSSLAEIQQRKDQLQYRQVWLQAILEETQREIKFIAPIAQLDNPNQEKPISED